MPAPRFRVFLTALTLLACACPAGAQSKLTISSPAGPVVIANPRLTLQFTISPAIDGKLRMRVDGAAVIVENDTLIGEIPLKAVVPVTSALIDLRAFANQGPKELFIDLVKTEGPKEVPQESVKLVIEVDTEGPHAERVHLLGTPGGAAVLKIHFKNDDFKATTLKAGNFKLERTAGAEGFNQIVPVAGDPTQEGNVLNLPLGFLVTDTYRLTIFDQAVNGVAESPLKDVRDNRAQKKQFFFTAFPERDKGEHVPYPRFLRPGKDGPKQESFDPGDRVDSRVIRLFYYRDANKVVEIINRDAKHLNAAGVDRERFLAQEARFKAEKLTDERRFAEVKAVQAVNRARELQQQIQDKQRELAEVSAGQAPPPGEDKDKAAVRLNEEIRQLRQQLSNAQQAEITESNHVVKMQADEDRSVEEQFRREVAAAKSEYDTYAKGQVASFDPVTQCTMSVIGEGLIQVRGPIKGINKIARIVHQIDVPVGQVKVGIHTVQINGEHGDRMEYVYEKIDRHIAHCRFLTNASLQTFRKAVQKVASLVAQEVEFGAVPPGFEPKPGAAFNFNQLSRDMKYIYSFFGKDFIDELMRMDSELLKTDNKLLSLNSMDTISLAGAMLLTALAKNEVRERIMQEFMAMIQGELPRIEVDYLRALTTIRHHDPCVDHILTNYFQNRLDCKDAKKVHERAIRTYQFSNLTTFFGDQIAGSDTLNSVQHAVLRMAQALKAQLVAEIEFNNIVLERSLLEKSEGEIVAKARWAANQVEQKEQLLREAKRAQFETQTESETSMESIETKIGSAIRTEEMPGLIEEWNRFRIALRNNILKYYVREMAYSSDVDSVAANIYRYFQVEVSRHPSRLIREELRLRLANRDKEIIAEIATAIRTKVRPKAIRQVDTEINAKEAERASQEAKKEAQAYNKQLFAKRLLDQMMDDQEQKAVELLEAMRSHVSNVDNYMKRMAIALEDDVMAQFYNPAFQMVRRASRFWDVTLGQVETTTILTNNRAFAKVLPTATMEFDLPKRDILIKEGLQSAKAVALTYGELLRDPTFLAATSMFSGTPKLGEPNNIMQPFTLVNGQPPQPKPTFGSAFDALIPPPEVYKFETGTGFEIRPVIQPDGQSILYNFNYMYTTNVREPIRADEKHLGRIKRHFIHTDVQTGSYELRELSRYTVSLKVSRTAKGVPLLQDIPGVGTLFRPLPSQASSLQQNIILASSTIYPTTFELMGLRWSPYGDELNSPKLAKQKEVHQKRKDEMRNELLSQVRMLVNERIGIESKAVPLEEAPEEPWGQAPFPPGAPMHGAPMRGASPHQAVPKSQGELPFIPHAPQLVPQQHLPPVIDNKGPQKDNGPRLPKPDEEELAPLPKVKVRGQGAAAPTTPANPPLAAAFAARAMEHLQKKDYDRALLDSSHAVQLDPRSGNGFCIRGLASYFRKDYDRAFLDFKSAIEADPSCVSAFVNRAMVHLIRNEHAKAISDCTAALQLHPNHAQALYNRYLAHQAAGQLNEARADYEAAVRLDPRLAAR